VERVEVLISKKLMILMLECHTIDLHHLYRHQIALNKIEKFIEVDLIFLDELMPVVMVI
jgi:hypothetical protein